MKDVDAGPLTIERDGDVLGLTLDRPGNANALSPDLVEALIEVLSEPRDIRLCVLRGTGRHFCAGFDLSEIETLSDGDLLWRFLRIETLLQMVHHAPFPIMALAQGQAVGAGADLFAACWHRIAAPDARFRMPGWNFELALGTRRLANLIGSAAARDMLIDTRTVLTTEAREIGLATDVVDPAAWPGAVDAMRRRTAVLPPAAMREMLALTIRDTRSEDMAALVATAARPGLRDRVAAYRERMLEKAGKG